MAEKKKHMADGRPALVIGIGPDDEHGGSHGDEDGPIEDVTDADGLSTMKAFHEASAKGDHEAMWHALKSAVRVASGDEESGPEEEEEPPMDDSKEAIGEH